MTTTTPHPEIVLFDGTGLEGWTMCGEGRFELVDGSLETRGGMGLLWYSVRPFDDFVLRLEWQVGSEHDNSGVFVRFPDPGDDPWTAVHNGYEVQILDDAEEPERRTGAIYRFQAPASVPTVPAGGWNRMEVACAGQRYDVSINDTKVTSFTGDRSLRGYVGLQNHDADSTVRFRDVRVIPGPAGPPL
jgi:hypothetical protein